MGRNFFLSSLCVLIILQSSWASDIRLPKSIVPEHYRLKMIPVLADEQFEIFGSVRIHIYVQEATDFITVHGKGINVTEVSEIRKKHEESSSSLDPDVGVVNVTYDVSRDFITFQLNETLQQRERYEFTIHYKAALETNLRGLYRSSYLDRETNETRWLAVTQMEPTDARRAFPCFDEPAMKATFEISLGRTNKMSSQSNMPLRKTEPMRLSKGWVWDHFEKSVPMSTYLVACLVSDFDFRAGEPLVRSVSPEFRETTSNVTEVRIWSRPDAVNETKLAVDATTKMLDFLESYFQVPFPLPKVDLVAVPDFSSGAMENWGLITFRETALLFDSKEAVVRDRSNVLRIIAHELAHQWFGNLVTMKWWNDLWLNEGFASYVQDLVMVEVAPEFDFHVASSLELQYVMGPDALESSHPISVEVEHPNQITEIFDEISYKKGSAVIRMMHNFLGDGTFRQGLTNYLTTLKYRNAEQDDLWRFLSEQAHADEVLPPNVDVKTIMDTWTLQKGYPVVNLERKYEDSTILLRQERFIRRTSSMNDSSIINVVDKNGAGLREQGLDSKWWVPISMTDSASRDFSAKNTRPKLWLSPDLLSAHRETAAGPDDWIVLNVGVSGYYRVNYDSQNWELISRQLLKDHQAIHTANRAQLIDDAFALAAAGILPYSRPLDLIEYLPLENHYVPWTSALRSLAYIRNMVMFTPQLGRWKSYLSSLVIPAFERIGFDITESDDPLTILAKVTLNGQACAASFKPCILRAQELFQLWQESKDPVNDLTISPDIRSTIYCSAIKYGSDSDWEFAWNMTTKVTSPQHRDVLLSALGCSREPWILIRYLSWILDEKSGIRLQDGRRIVTAVANNPVGRYLSFTFLKDNWNALVQRYASVRTPLRMLESATMLYNTPYDLSEVQSFMDQRKAELSTSSASLKKITTNIAANIQWMNANYNFIVKWMENKQL